MAKVNLVRVVLAAAAIRGANVLGIAVSLPHQRAAVHLAAAVGAVDQPGEQVRVAVGLGMRSIGRTHLAAPPVVQLGLHPFE